MDDAKHKIYYILDIMRHNAYTKISKGEEYTIGDINYMQQYIKYLNGTLEDLKADIENEKN